jgi:hypothetical protein
MLPRRPLPPIMTPIRHHLAAEFERFALEWPAQADTAREFSRFLASADDVFDRSHVFGHFTGSSWLVSADGLRVLLTHHRKLDRWLQLGGHADGEEDLARVALVEAEEESGLSGLVLEGGIFDLDRHLIPARKADPDHYHYDVRYVVRASGSEDYVVGDESHDLAWRPIIELVDEPGLDDSVRRMALRWIRQHHDLET